MEGSGLLCGRYELRDVLGMGGMAVVRDGWDTYLMRSVAIKQLHPGLGSKADVRERFKVEACAAAALNHPNIVGVYDFGEQDGMPFIVMERLPGDTLGDQIAFGSLPQPQVNAALRDVLAALSAAHGAGMLHRDIKPGNVLLTGSGSVKVADFGIVKTPGAAQTSTGQVVGTLAYLSSDRIAGKPASVADDLYAAGVLGYEALTGRKPFIEEDIAPLARAILEGRPPRLRDLRSDVDPRLAEVIERAMSPEPSHRFATADAMLAALGVARRPWETPTPIAIDSSARPPTWPIQLASGAPSTSTDVTTTIPRPDRHRGRRAAGALAAVGALAVAVLALSLDKVSTTLPSAPEPVSVTTPVASLAPVSAPAIDPSALPSPVVLTPTESPVPVFEQATQQDGHGSGKSNGKSNGNGNGNGHGNGHGDGNGHGRKPK